MISKELVQQLVEQWLEGKDYFLTDLTVSADARIVVEIDHEEGVWIEDCVTLSRFIENGLDRDEEDFELEVGSAEGDVKLRAGKHSRVGGYAPAGG